MLFSPSNGIYAPPSTDKIVLNETKVALLIIDDNALQHHLSSGAEYTMWYHFCNCVRV